jgi:hypothetical protein
MTTAQPTQPPQPPQPTSPRTPAPAGKAACPCTSAPPAKVAGPCSNGNGVGARRTSAITAAAKLPQATVASQLEHQIDGPQAFVGQIPTPLSVIRQPPPGTHLFYHFSRCRDCSCPRQCLMTQVKCCLESPLARNDGKCNDNDASASKPRPSRRRDTTTSLLRVVAHSTITLWPANGFEASCQEIE